MNEAGMKLREIIDNLTEKYSGQFNTVETQEALIEELFVATQAAGIVLYPTAVSGFEFQPESGTLDINVEFEYS